MKDLIKTFSLFVFMFQCLQAQECKLEAGKKGEIFYGAYQSEDHGILVISGNPYKRNFTFSFIDMKGQLAWEKSIPGSIINYKDNYTDSKVMQVFMGNQRIYIIHNGLSGGIPVKLNPVVLDMSYTGDYTVKAFEPFNYYRFIDYVFENQSIYALYKKIEKKDTAIYCSTLNTETAKLEGTRKVEIPKSFIRFKDPDFEGRSYYFLATVIDSNQRQLRFFRYGFDGLIRNGNHSKMGFPKGYNPIPDIVNTHAFFRSDESVHFSRNVKDESYFIYGLMARYDGEHRESGFYIQKYDFDDSLLFEKYYTYEVLKKTSTTLKDLCKETNYVLSFSTEKTTDDLFFLIKDANKKKADVYCFALNSEGKLIRSLTSGAPWFRALENFSIISKQEVNFHTSPYQICFLEKTNEPSLAHSHSVISGLSGQKEKYAAIVTLKGANFLMNYLPKDESILIHKL